MIIAKYEILNHWNPKKSACLHGVGLWSSLGSLLEYISYKVGTEAVSKTHWWYSKESIFVGI